MSAQLGRSKSKALVRVRPHLVAVTGGSGSGKTWLADKLQAAFAPNAARLSLDDFYLDRSHLSPARRATINFDHPRAIDWAALQLVLRRLLAGWPAPVPNYDFATHSRLQRSKILAPKKVIFVDGLWLLVRPSLRRLFLLTIYLDCSPRLRLQRRLARDRLLRGRTHGSVCQQFWRTVEPMHERYVAPQMRWANVVVRKNLSRNELCAIESSVRNALSRPGSQGKSPD